MKAPLVSQRAKRLGESANFRAFRPDDSGFAVLCVTTPPSGLTPQFPAGKRVTSDPLVSSQILPSSQLRQIVHDMFLRGRADSYGDRP